MTEPIQEEFIDDAKGLAELVAHLREEGQFAFDTEFVSEDTFEPILCLIQVATRKRLAIVDPLAIRDIGPFWQAVIDPTIEVVMHAAGEDLRICRFQTGFLPARVVDVQIAAGLVGMGYPLSLGNLLGQVLHVSVTGGETRTDWRRRPLSEAQIQYALDDVRHLLRVVDTLKAGLQKLGRTEWAEAEYADFIEVIRRRDDDERWRKLSGLHQLSRRGLEAARLLYEWRSEEARRSNRPMRQVMRDDLLTAIAKRQPSSRRDLEALRDYNRPHLLAKSQEVVEVIQAAQATPAESLPEAPERFDEGPGLSMVVSLLAATLARCCAEHKVATGLVGSAADLKELIRWSLDGSLGLPRPVLADGWRDQVCGQTLLEVLAGRTSLRVVDPLAEVPVALEKRSEG
ncbi:HRDC domain-containing protein [Isosphaeraceae bacterium EP7]